MKICFLLLFALTTSGSFCQQNKNPFADTAFIYQGFGAGGSTAALSAYSKAVDSISGIKKIN
ncbi:MAG: hypothetical protein H7Y86_21150 [Rhizobacter sp.]|nr:hypothetical protein [Ferruginibacter sp.]